MKVAIIGSRNLTSIDLSNYLPLETTEIVSGGAKGIDQLAKDYAILHDIKLTECFPDYVRFRKGAPLRRNDTIIQYSDMVLAFWNGTSHGTKYVIEQCQRTSKPHRVIVCSQTLK